MSFSLRNWRKGKSAGDSYVAAGFKANRGNAGELGRKEHILIRVGELLEIRRKTDVMASEKAMEALAIDKASVMARLVENIDRAMQAVKVLDHKGKPTGEYRYDGNVANRALELLGKEIGMFIDRKQVTNLYATLSDAELDAAIARLEREIEVGARAGLN